MTLEVEFEGELDDALQFVRSPQHFTKSLEATWALDDEFSVKVGSGVH